MSSRERCICSAPMTRQSFSPQFDALRCTQCGTRHFVPALGVAASEFCYDGDNAKYAQPDYLYGNGLRWAHMELLKQTWAGRKVLEIGCFNGFFLNELKKLGANVYGFDVNHGALAVGENIFDLAGSMFSSMTTLAAIGPFDDVLCIDLIEHLEQPETFLNEMAALLKPGGKIVVAGPTVERSFHDKSDYPPHHKWWFSRAGLIACLQRGGFVVAGTAVQRDGMLFARNFIGKALNGLHKREFYGESTLSAPAHDGPISRRAYATLSWFGQVVFRLLGISYCSTIIMATKSELA